MAMTYQQQYVLDGAAGRDAILNLTARHNRCYSEGDRIGWIATFRHSGASFTRDGEEFTDLREAFDGGNGTPCHRRPRDHRRRHQCDPALRRTAFRRRRGRRHQLRATGSYRDQLIYERGGWYFTSRELEWDSVPNRHSLTV